jgi:hypothetical protein
MNACMLPVNASNFEWMPMSSPLFDSTFLNDSSVYMEVVDPLGFFAFNSSIRAFISAGPATTTTTSTLAVATRPQLPALAGLFVPPPTATTTTTTKTTTLTPVPTWPGGSRVWWSQYLRPSEATYFPVCRVAGASRAPLQWLDSGVVTPQEFYDYMIVGARAEIIQRFRLLLDRDREFSACMRA